MHNHKNLLLFILIVIFSAAAFLITIGHAKAEAPEPTPEELKAAAMADYEESLNAWINKLGACESTNNAHAVTAIDSDGTPSFGRFQYKAGTFISYNKKYNIFPGESTDRLMARMMDYNDSAKMTRAIVEGDKNGWKNWTNCTKKNGLPPVLPE